MSIKVIISDFKLINKYYKNKIKECLVILIFTLFASIFGAIITNMYLFLILNLMSVLAVVMQYTSNFYPFFRRIENEVKLEIKYQFIYERFTKQI